MAILTAGTERSHYEAKIRLDCCVLDDVERCGRIGPAADARIEAESLRCIGPFRPPGPADAADSAIWGPAHRAYTADSTGGAVRAANDEANARTDAAGPASADGAAAADLRGRCANDGSRRALFCWAGRAEERALCRI